MPKYYRDVAPYLASFMGGSTAACGTTSTNVAVPSGANWAIIHAEGAAVYWTINSTPAASTSAGYAAADTVGYIPPIDNLGTLTVIGSGTAAVAHVEFYQD